MVVHQVRKKPVQQFWFLTNLFFAWAFLSARASVVRGYGILHTMGLWFEPVAEEFTDIALETAAKFSDKKSSQFALEGKVLNFRPSDRGRPNV